MIMMKRLLLPLLACSMLVASEPAFDELMGKGTATWSYVETREDQTRINFFKHLYERAQAMKAQGKIPKTLHFIWLGPTPYPVASMHNLEKWIQLHPDWTVKFWSDQERLVLMPQVEMVSFKDFPLGPLTECYFQSDNFGERSELLRYCILCNEGGFYIDHDLVPLKPLDAWRESVDFLCGLEPIQPSIMSSSVIVGTSFLGSIPHHPFLEEALAWLHQEWSRLEIRYPGHTSDAVYNRVMHRSKRALDQGIQTVGCHSVFRNLVLPSPYFNSGDPKEALCALHLHSQSWLKKNTLEEKGIKILLQTISSRMDLLSFLLYCLGALNLLAGLYLFVAMTKKRKEG